MGAMSSDQPALFETNPEPALPTYTPEDFPFFHGPQALARNGLIDESWVPTLLPFSAQLRAIAQELAARSQAGERLLPDPALMLRALELPAEEVKVLIVGQDPYPTPGHAIGLSFATEAQVRPLPRSLSNIYRELHDDLGIPPAVHGDLSAWQEQGVMLLNQVFSVGAGAAGSHQKIGWTHISAAVIDRLNRCSPAVIALLWGNQAQKLAPQLDQSIILRSAHPSPLSASRGFFGSKPFSAINRELRALGREEISWQLP